MGGTGEFPSPPQEEAPAPVPQQQSYEEWDTTTYADAQYGGYGGDQYQAAPQQYPAGSAYDQTYQQGYDATYDPAQPHQHGSERPDGSQQ
jgi:hypothetical protein